jgi:hypothetical protein
MTLSSAPVISVASPAARPASPQAPVACPALPITHSPGNPTLTLPLPPSSCASARDRRPSFALRESVNSQKKRGCADPELAAVVANCGAIEEVEDPEPPKKVAKKKEVNKDFFNIIKKTGTIKINRISFLLYSNCQEPLATIVNNNTVNINEANITLPSYRRSSQS